MSHCVRSPSFASHRGVTVSYSGLLSVRRSVILFCHVTSWMLHTLWLILKFIHEFKVCACIVKKKKKDAYTYMFVRHCCSCSWMKKNMCRIPRKKNNCINSQCDLRAVCGRLFLFHFLFFSIFFSFVLHFGDICQWDVHMVGTVVFLLCNSELHFPWASKVKKMLLLSCWTQKSKF